MAANTPMLLGDLPSAGEPIGSIVADATGIPQRLATV